MTADYTLQANFPYLFGVYLAVNSMPDVQLFIDGPDCTIFKAQFIQGKHDLYSSLLDPAGGDRIISSIANINRIITDRTEELKAQLRAVDSRGGAALTLLTSMPMTTITGTQYDLLVRALQPELTRPLLEVPARSLSGDWLDGYAAVLETLAQHIELRETVPRDDAVAVVGYFMDRTEHDHRGNVAELRRLLDGLDLETAAIWLSAEPCAELARVAEAGTIIALPHGREAARILARRTGAKVVDAALPFGLKPTIDWLRTVGEATGRDEQAAGLIDRELRRAAPRLTPVVEKVLLGTRVLFCGDPHHFGPFVEFMKEVGCTVQALFSAGREEHLDPLPAAVKEIPILFEPRASEQEELMAELDEPLDLAIQSDSFGWRGPGDYAVLPFGCACHRWHALADTPWLGFKGAVTFIDRMANALMSRGR